MKKYGYYIFNTIIFLLLVASINNGIYLYCIGETRHAATMGVLASFTEEELVDYFKDDEIFNDSLKRYDEGIKEYKEDLNNLDVSSDEYKNTIREINFLEKYKYEYAVFKALVPETEKGVKIGVIIVDVAMAVLYALGMFIFVKIKNKKATKKVKSKSTNRK